MNIDHSNHPAYSRRAVLPVFCGEVTAVALMSYASYYSIEMIKKTNRYGSASTGLWGYYYDYLFPCVFAMTIFVIIFGLLEVLPTFLHVLDGKPLEMSPDPLSTENWPAILQQLLHFFHGKVPAENEKPQKRIMVWGVCAWVFMVSASSYVYDAAFVRRYAMQSGEDTLMCLVAISGVIINMIMGMLMLCLWPTTIFKYWMFSAVDWKRRTVSDRAFVGELYRMSIDLTIIGVLVFAGQLFILATNLLNDLWASGPLICRMVLAAFLGAGLLYCSDFYLLSVAAIMKVIRKPQIEFAHNADDKEEEDDEDDEEDDEEDDDITQECRDIKHTMCVSADDETVRDCQICMTCVANMAYQCGHVFCPGCANIMVSCPRCRAPVEKRIKLFE